MTRTILALGVAAALVLLVARAMPQAAEPVNDTRQRVVLAPAARDRILAEMRAMLQSLGAIAGSLGNNDVAGAERAARASGMGTAADVRPEVKRQLPPGFLTLGMQTHVSFDRLADALAAGANRDEALRGLATLTANCVACHAAYRLDEAR